MLTFYEGKKVLVMGDSEPVRPHLVEVLLKGRICEAQDPIINRLAKGLLDSRYWDSRFVV